MPWKMRSPPFRARSRVGRRCRSEEHSQKTLPLALAYSLFTMTRDWARDWARVLARDWARKSLPSRNVGLDQGFCRQEGSVGNILQSHLGQQISPLLL